MREIKFRAWSNKYQHMFRGSEISQDRSGYTHGIVDAEFKNEFEPEFDSPFAWIGRVDFKKSSDGRVAALGQNPDDEPFYLMQYTGLKDKSEARQEIWEGDIRKDALGRIFKVVYDNDLAAFYGEYTNGHYESLGDCGPDSEFLGTVYQNPELLEASHVSQ
ncbi:YopX family protein [Bacillus subtilis]|uniref:YopX family protein n=1 Tax=Bacillus subtilis group TaxID=653685 RepID=UPI00077237F3|nr:MULTISPECIES: YopX family protein [Bacillus subtilis group]KXJ32621.1 hypothetical protein AX282_12110 [Bacillus spizizenii]